MATMLPFPQPVAPLKSGPYQQPGAPVVPGLVQQAQANIDPSVMPLGATTSPIAPAPSVVADPNAGMPVQVAPEQAAFDSSAEMRRQRMNQPLPNTQLPGIGQPLRRPKNGSM